MEETLKKLVDEISSLATEGREITYSKNAIGITTLLFCPLKAEFRQQHPEIKTEGPEIDDGYFFEKAVKQAATNLFGKRTLIEPTIPYESPQGVRIEGHPDLVIVGKEKVLALECKAPNFLFSTANGIGDSILFCKNGQTVSISPHYQLQARIQKFLLQKHFNNKEIVHYIFAKTLIRSKSRLKKVYIFHETQTAATQQEMEYMISQFLNEKSPRYPWECHYCPYKKHGICEGKAVTQQAAAQTLKEVPPHLKNLTESYIQAHTTLKEIEAMLKEALPPDTHIELPLNGKPTKIGWITRTRYIWNIPKLFNILGKQIFDFLYLKPRATAALEEAIQRSGKDPQQFREKTSKTTWKAL